MRSRLFHRALRLLPRAVARDPSDLLPRHHPSTLMFEALGALKILIDLVLNPPFEGDEPSRYRDQFMYHAGALDQGVAMLHVVALHAPEMLSEAEQRLIEELHRKTTPLCESMGLDASRSARLHQDTRHLELAIRGIRRTIETAFAP